MTTSKIDLENFDFSQFQKEAIEKLKEYQFLPVMYLPLEKSSCRGLQTFVRVKSWSETSKGIEESCRYYISSCRLKSIDILSKLFGIIGM